MERVSRVDLSTPVQFVTSNRDLWVQGRDPASRFYPPKEFGVPVFREESTRSSYSVVPFKIWWDTVGVLSGSDNRPSVAVWREGGTGGELVFPNSLSLYRIAHGSIEFVQQIIPIIELVRIDVRLPKSRSGTVLTIKTVGTRRNQPMLLCRSSG